jgi:molecular chaperone DnaK
MVKDAELNAEEDKKVKELAESRNQADALVHSTRKSLTEYGDKLEAGEKEKIEASITDLEGAIKSGDKADIDAKVAALTTASQKLGEKMYADMQAQQGGADAQAGGQPGADAGAKQDDDVVDADFKEVKDAK